MNISLPPDDLDALDAYAKAEHGGNRSAAISARIPVKYREPKSKPRP